MDASGKALPKDARSTPRLGRQHAQHQRLTEALAVGGRKRRRTMAAPLLLGLIDSDYAAVMSLQKREETAGLSPAIVGKSVDIFLIDL